MRFITSILIQMTLLISAPVLAHHGAVTNSALYFADELVEIEGELTEVFWHNPHTRARLRVVNDDGEGTTWELELGPTPRQLESMGLIPEDLLGNVKAAGYVSKRNAQSFGVLYFLLPDGREYVQGRAREPRWSSVRLASVTSEIDPAKVRAAEAAADGIFRMWGESGRGLESDLNSRSLTQRGRDLAAAYDPLTDNGQLDCQHGMPGTMFGRSSIEISDEGDRIRIHVAQYDIQRVIHLDVEEPLGESQASPVGYSVGRWDADVLVVTTTHVDWPYYSNFGTPQSDQVSYVERFSVSDDGQILNYSITIADPAIFAEPFTMERTRQAAPGVEIEPYNCVAGWQDPAG